MYLMLDPNGNPIQGFAPREGSSLSGSITPTKNRLVKLASEVAISIDGKTVTYEEGYELPLSKGRTYSFGSAVDIHEM